MKKEDQRIKITKMLIRKSFATIVKTKPIDKISIRELCLEAGINRGTFYTHYKDIEALVKEIREDFFSTFKTSILKFLNQENPVSFLTNDNLIASILSMLYENRDLCVIMLHSTDSINFVQELNNIGLGIVSKIYPNYFKDKTLDDVNVYYCYVSGGSIALLVEWFETNCERPIPDLAHKLNRLIESSLSYFK